MSKILDGYQNEFLFVLEFNNKKIKELNPLLREVIDDLFYGCSEESIVKAWRNHRNIEKGDIMLKVNGHIRSISIKKGSRNSVHTESLEKFKTFLKINDISDNVIKEYINYHYGVDNYSNRTLSSSEFCLKNTNNISLINDSFKKIDYRNIVDRFILKGNSGQYYSVDGIIYGVPNDFFWINKNQIKEIIQNSINRESKSVHYGCLFIQPFIRCMDNNYRHYWRREYVQIKWYSLYDDIIEYKNSILSNKK